MKPSGDICIDASGNGHEASLEPGRREGLHRVEGLFGSALSLSGRHLLRVPARPDFRGRQQLSFSAWVKPASFERYNEIFRKEDGEQRVLFSFQENGTVLSLGLNVGGYVECDAKMDPLDVLDGQWHHCAATFDGGGCGCIWMVAPSANSSAPAPSPLAARRPGASVPSTAASVSRAHWMTCAFTLQALTKADVLSLYRSGQVGLERFARDQEERLSGIYVSGTSLAETLAGSRAKLLEQRRSADLKTVAAVVARAKQRHPQDYGDFIRLTRH